MRIPVLMILPAQEPLRESALAAQEYRTPTIPLYAASIPKQLELDSSYSAIPVGTGSRADTAAASLRATASDRFAVRGFIEAETPDDIPKTVDGRPVFADPKIQPFITCGGTVPIGDAARVKQKLRVAQLAAKGLDGTNVAIAIMDTGINLMHLKIALGAAPKLDAGNSWTAPGTTIAPGRHEVEHGTMCAYDALIAAPRATLLDYPILNAVASGGSTAAGSLSTALVAYSHLMANWSVAFARGGAAQYRALVVNNSWGVYHPRWDCPAGHPGRYIDNPRHPFNLIVSVLASTGADILYAAGNCGADCADSRCAGRTTETIMGANAHSEVLTVAGCDINDQRVGYSSQGPSIAGMQVEKPDLTTYTHFRGSEAFGPGSADSGTSTACPVAAGCVAALRTKLPPGTIPPANLFAQLRSTAMPAGGMTGWNGEYGHGLLDPLQAAQSLGL